MDFVIFSVKSFRVVHFSQKELDLDEAIYSSWRPRSSSQHHIASCGINENDSALMAMSIAFLNMVYVVVSRLLRLHRRCSLDWLTDSQHDILGSRNENRV